MNQPDVLPPPLPRTWAQRNWKWVVPVSIIAGLGALLCFVGLIFLFMFSLLQHNDAYRVALARARGSPGVVHELGEPIEAGWWISGSINVTGPSGSADFETPLHGPSGRGTLYVTAEKRAGRWQYKVLEVAVEGKSDRINLLSEGNGV